MLPVHNILTCIGALAGTLNLDGETLSAESATSPTYCRFKLDNDGFLYYSYDTGTPSWTKFDTAADWVRPVAHAGDGTYYARFTNLAGDTGSASANQTEDAWVQITGSATITVEVHDSVDGGLGKNITFDIEIGTDGSTADVSNSYDLTANYTTV